MYISQQTGRKQILKKELSQENSMSEDEENEMVEEAASQKQESFAQKLGKLKESREKLLTFIDLKGPNELYSLDVKKYDHNIIDPKLLHVKANKDIIDLADSSIKKMTVNKKVKKNWSKEDIIILAWLIDKYGKNPDDYEEADWRAIAQLIPGKDHEQSMFKWMSLRNTRKSAQKREWLASEEIHLKQIVERLGNKSWFEVSKELYHVEGKRLRIYRSPKHCRERWACYLDPKVKKGPWKPSEDLILLKEFLKIGKKWSHIAKKLNGRTENAIKNRFTLLLDKKIALCKLTKNPMTDEAYIKNQIENIEVGLMITSNPDQIVVQDVADQKVSVHSQPAQPARDLVKLEAPTFRKPLKRAATLHQPPVSFTRPLQQNEQSSPAGNLFDLRKPVTVKVERMTVELLREFGRGSIRPAILNAVSSELFFKEEQTTEFCLKDQRDIDVSEEGIGPTLNIGPSGESDYEYFYKSSEDVIF